MAELNFNHITKSFGDLIAVNDVSLDVASGEFISLLGPSGCGKTTLLRIIAGFTTPDSGEILIRKQRVDALPPSRRKIGFVFQSYALFPIQTVAENIGFALRIKHRPKAEINDRVRTLCELTKLQGMEDRYPHELSGGQQQRVALARALAPNPEIFLLDEPLSALDAKIRVHLRTEIRAIVERLGITTVYVTHDQEEALSIADRVVVMNEGLVQQVDSPSNVYLRPSNQFVADFIGTSNYFSAYVLDSEHVKIEEMKVQLSIPEELKGHKRYEICVRPEQFNVSSATSDNYGQIGRIISFSFLGQSVRTSIETKSGQKIAIDVPSNDWVKENYSRRDSICWSIKPGCGTVFSPQEIERGNS